jgi:SAM-dependent methyltransferase
MNSPEVKAEARLRTRAVPVKVVTGTHRWNVVDGLPATGNVGIELGVAGGSFSARMVKSGRFRQFWGVDSYADAHNVKEYKQALLTIGMWSDYRLLRMTFAEALDLFPDGSFDFIYVDGYAHTGEEGGKTLVDWYSKLKPGGIFAGDDYAPDTWPLTVWAVNEVAAQLGVTVNVTELVRAEAFNKHPSWYFQRPLCGPATLEMPEALEIIGQAEKLRVAEARKRRREKRRAAVKAGAGRES